jgi:nitrite reductase (cytochrome c-552)
MKKLYVALVVLVALATAGVMALLMNIFERKKQAGQYPLKVVEIAEDEVDAAVWGKNFPRQYDSFIKTRENYGRTFYGGSFPYQKHDENPRLRRLWAGNPFAVDYREERGHEWALHDVKDTLRTQKFKQPTTCFTCKSAQVPKLMKEMGVAEFYKQPFDEMKDKFHHSISCSDCHEPRTMQLRITRPAFKEAMETMGVDISKATRQEMRSYVCAQCHVEYYFRGEGKFLVFPWSKGLKVEDIEAHYDEYNFTDWVHAETKTKMLKMQHPEFEMWSQGIHARSGVSCADCHMPYIREGAVKITDHWIRSPLKNIAQSCQVCHRWGEQELVDRVLVIQNRTYKLMVRAEEALMDCIDAIVAAMESGATDEQLEEARALHRKAQMRWDFVNAENSMGFHAPQEAARILGEAIDYARQAQISAQKIEPPQHARAQTE